MATIPTTQKSLVLPAEGSPYTVAKAAVPRPGPDDVLVKIEATGINPFEWKVATPIFSWLIPGYPFITGTDGAGVVVEIGENVSKFTTGDRIVFQGFMRENAQATFQQYAITTAALAAHIPENISFEAAATLPATFGTAALIFFNPYAETECLGLKPFWEEGGNDAYAGKPIFIVGGATSLGQYSIQLAKLAGFGPIITTASPRNAALLTELGATHVVDRSLSADAVLAEVLKVAAGKPFEVAVDAVSSPESQSLAYQVLAPGGALALALPDQIPAELKKDGDAKRIVFIHGSVHLPQHRKIGEEIFGRLTGWLEQGIIKPNAFEVLPGGLAGIVGGLERLKNNQVSAKKLVAKPQETP
ncbi:GroES-like protein [Trametes versicolor FP-101664 SS1]|uniref:GroES-like protein n=1 Tax=Trametes versicolor (strain FP-101664) TaxID=717944 RepID=UPI000462123E|nr:GroES-like protein [Trametes versicolor FP-101664 SS1]EIW57189.1 GroES-like protein [Trametes versicolor FP-101664 SS1]